MIASLRIDRCLGVRPKASCTGRDSYRGNSCLMVGAVLEEKRDGYTCAEGRQIFVCFGRRTGWDRLCTHWHFRHAKVYTILWLDYLKLNSLCAQLCPQSLPQSRTCFPIEICRENMYFSEEYVNWSVFPIYLLLHMMTAPSWQQRVHQSHLWLSFLPQELRFDVMLLFARVRWAERGGTGLGRDLALQIRSNQSYTASSRVRGVRRNGAFCNIKSVAFSEF